MDIFNLYSGMKIMFSMMGTTVPSVFYYALALAVAVWLGLFILQGFGLYTMASRRSMKGKWKAFVPFVNVHYIGKLTGDCYVFGQRVKRAGLYAMLAQIAVAVLCGLVVASEIYLYSTCGMPKYTDWETPYWTDLQGFSLTVSRFFDISSYILSIFQLVYELLMLVLLLGLYKKYYPKNYMVLGFLELFVPISRYIVIFVLRNREAVDYEAYMRARHEAYMRRRQQYQNPYGNPYGSPYNNPYGNSYGNPYGSPQASQNAPEPDDPFEEFKGNKQAGENRAENENDPDNFFS